MSGVSNPVERSLSPSGVDIGSICPALTCGADGVWREQKTSAAVAYPESGNADCFTIEENSFWFKHRNQAIVEAARAFPPQGAIFDVGGGNGFVASALASDGFEVVLVEPGEFGIENARRRGVAQIIAATFEGANFRDESLPAVGLFDVLEHVEDDQGFLRTVFDALAPGGRLYLTVPAYQWLWSFEDDHAEHFRRYSLTSLQRVIAASGFEEGFASYFFSFLPLPIFCLRSLPGRLRLRRSFTVQRVSREHAPSTGFTNKVMNSICGWEIGRLQAQQPISFGSSCLLVATKPMRER